MTLDESRFNILPPPVPINYAAQKLGQLQADLVSAARMWAMNEVGAAMAHQLNQPLTALLLYLHQIKANEEHPAGAESASDARREMVDRALLETARVCDVMKMMGHAVVAPMNADTAIARGREAIDWVAGNSNARGSGGAPSAPNDSSQHLLTPRERQVLALITGGASNKEGGRQLEISTRTFEVHRAHIMGKLGARNAADLVRMVLVR